MKISRSLYREVIMHAFQSSPNECCGIIATDKEGTAVSVHPCANVSDNPKLHYMISGREQHQIWTHIAQNNLHWGAIYHSHPTEPPYPSPTDILMFRPYSNPLCAIVSLADNRAVMKLYRFGAHHAANLYIGDVDEEELIIIA